jgi:hypothetical protein
MRALVALAALLASGAALAGNAVLTWTAPTTYVDGTALPASKISGYKIEWGTTTTTCAAATYPSNTTVPATPLTYTVSNLSPGIWCFRAYTNADTGQSAATNPVSKTVVAPLPGPPGSLTVADLTAFDIVKQKDRLVMLPVGTVPADTKCDPTTTVNGYYAVPSDAATWFGTVRPPVIFARCT